MGETRACRKVSYARDESLADEITQPPPLNETHADHTGAEQSD
jgi:hypothetical protein